MISRSVAGVAVLLVLGMMLGQSPVHALTVQTGQTEIIFDEYSGVPVQWTVCALDCARADARRMVLMREADGYVRITTPTGPGGLFQAEVEETVDQTVVRFVAANESYIYRLSRTTPEVTLELPPQSRVEFATGSSFVPAQMAGFGQLYSRVLAVQVSDAGQSVFADPDEGMLPVQASGSNWTGIRNRYWAMLAQPVNQDLEAQLGLAVLDRPVVTLGSGAGAEPQILRIYAGAIEWNTLKSVSPVLSELLFAALWDFFRALCFGMLILLDFLYGLVGSYGLAIILLSLTVKILMTPLTLLADRWQADVNRIQTLLQPRLDEIKRNYKGEKAHQLTLEMYKQHSISPMYTFKSAAGFLIQIPVFIAAFDMLAENFVLDEIGFLWIADLARPDAIAELPFVMPFFGATLNLLPFLMTGLSSLAAWLQAEDTLSPELQRRQSMRLYLMSGAFFILFYTFPAGMVLYWTSSNLFHLIKVESARLFKRSL